MTDPSTTVGLYWSKTQRWESPAGPLLACLSVWSSCQNSSATTWRGRSVCYGSNTASFVAQHSPKEGSNRCKQAEARVPMLAVNLGCLHP